MTRWHGFLITTTLLLAACRTVTPEQQFASDAIAGLGGDARLRAVQVLVIEGRGEVLNLGQDMSWEAAGQAFTLSDVRRAFLLDEPQARIEQTRTPNFLYFQGPQPLPQVLGVDGDVAYSVGANGRVSRQSSSVARERRTDIYHHPLSLVRALVDGRAQVSNIRNDNGTRTADVTLGDTALVVALDTDGRPLRVSSPGYHTNLGDVTTTTTFAEYHTVDGLSLPTQAVTTVDGHVTARLHIDRYVLDAPATTAAAPPEAASTPEPTPPAPVVEALVVSKGVWLLAGQSHHSALIEFADHLVLFEAPQSEARTLAVIAKARELVPGKPLTQMIMSHHHFDHSGGIRAAVSEGAGVIASARDTAFVEEIVKRPHSRQPDALQKAPRPLSVRAVEDQLALEDTAMSAVVYPLNGNPHANTMLMVYIPRDRLVIEADAFSPGGTYHPYAAHLLEALRARNLRVDRIVPLHGEITTLAELTKAVALNPTSGTGSR